MKTYFYQKKNLSSSKSKVKNTVKEIKLASTDTGDYVTKLKKLKALLLMEIRLK